MKKSTLLSFATAVAIVATSAGTYAAWDKTSDAAVMNKVTIRKKVSTTVTSAQDFKAEETNVLGDAAPVYTATIPVTVSDIPADAVGKYVVDVKAYAYTDKTKADAAAELADITTDTGNQTDKVKVEVENMNNAVVAGTTNLTPTVKVSPSNTNDGSVATDAYIVVKAEIIDKPTDPA